MVSVINKVKSFFSLNSIKNDIAAKIWLNQKTEKSTYKLGVVDSLINRIFKISIQKIVENHEIQLSKNFTQFYNRISDNTFELGTIDNVKKFNALGIVNILSKLKSGDDLDDVDDACDALLLTISKKTSITTRLIDKNNISESESESEDEFEMV